MSAPPRGLRPRRPATPQDPDLADTAAAVEARLQAIGALALVDADAERAVALGRSVVARGACVDTGDAAGAPSWVELDARLASDTQGLLGLLGLNARLHPGERPEDALVEALATAGWDLLLTHLSEAWLPAVERLFDARERGDGGPRVLVCVPLALVSFARACIVLRRGIVPSAEAAPRAHAVMTWLATARSPCSRTALAQLSGDIDLDETLSRLSATDLAHSTEDGWASANGLRAPASPAALRARATALKAAAATPIDHLAAAGVFIEAGDAGAALEALDDAAAAGVSALPAALLEQVLTRSADPRLDRWRLEAAVLCGSPDALAEVPAPLGQDVETRAVFAEVLYLRGHLSEARSLLEALRVEGALARPTSTSLRARRIAALVAAQSDEHALAFEALTVSDVSEGSDARDASALDAARALVLALAERPTEALAVVHARWSDHRWLTGLARERHVSDMLVTLVTCERLDLARRYRDEAAPRAVGPMPYLLALIATQSGDLDRAGALLTQCEQAFDALGAWHARARALRARWCLARGELEGLEGRIDALMRAAERLGDRGLFALGQTYHAALAVLVRCAPPPQRAWPKDAAPDAPPEGWPGVFLGRDGTRTGSVRQRAWAHVMQGHRALVAGDATQALHALDAGIALARSTGFTLDEIGALRLRLDACFLLGDIDGLRETDAALVALGAEASSRAVAAELGFMRALQRSPVPATALVEAAAAWDAATRTARRARALLGDSGGRGDPGGLDAIDTRVLDRAQPLCGAVRSSGPADAPWGRAWVLDHGARTLTRGALPVVDLAPTPLLWAVLTQLIAAEELDKETLVRSAWGVDDYHPLRDDNRLQVTMRKLRGLIELDPSAPRCVKTTSTGYAFASDLRVVHVHDA